MAFVRSLLHKASKSMPSGALGGAWRCVRRSNFSIQTWSSILPDAARVKDLRWTCGDGVTARSVSDAPRRYHGSGPKLLEIEKETTHVIVRWTRVDGVTPHDGTPRAHAMTPGSSSSIIVTSAVRLSSFLRSMSCVSSMSSLVVHSRLMRST